MEYGPDSTRQPDVPRGSVTEHEWTSQIFEKTRRYYWIYVPAQYDAQQPAAADLDPRGQVGGREEVAGQHAVGGRGREARVRCVGERLLREIGGCVDRLHSLAAHAMGMRRAHAVNRDR